MTSMVPHIYSMDWTIERGENDFDVEVHYHYFPGQEERGRFGPPEHYDPGSGPEIEILGAKFNGELIDLSETERSEIEDHIIENPPEPDEPDWDDRDDPWD